MGNKFYIILKTKYKYTADGYLTPVETKPVSICCDKTYAYQKIIGLNYKTDDDKTRFYVVEKDELPIVDGQVVIKI